MKTTNIIYSLILALCFVLGADAQNTNRWTEPDVEISVSPEIIKICAQEPVLVECVEDFLSYRWKTDDGEIIGTGKEINISQPGDYILAVEHNTNGVLCIKEFDFEVGRTSLIDDYLVSKTFINVYQPEEDIGLNGKSGKDDSRNTNCYLECDDRYNNQYPGNTNICYLPYTQFQYNNDHVCGLDGDPIADMLNIMLEGISYQKVVVATTDKEDLDNCCDLWQELIDIYLDPATPAMLWMHMEEGHEVTSIICKSQNGICESLSLPFEDVDPTNTPNYGVVNNSLLEINGKHIAANVTSNEVIQFGIKDYAKISEEFRQVINFNVQKAVDRWGINVEYIFSADCVTSIEDGLPSATKAQYSFENTEADLSIWFHINADGNVSFDIKIGEFTPNAALLADPDYNNQTKEEIKQALREGVAETLTREKSEIDNIISSPPGIIPEMDEPSMWQFGINPQRDEKEVNVFGLAKETGGIGFHIMETGGLPDGLWKVINDPLNESIFIIPACIAGVGDGVIQNNPVVGTIQLVGLGKDICTNEETRDAIIAVGKDIPGTVYYVLQDTWSNINGNQGTDVAHHTMGSGGVGIIFGAQAVNALKNAIQAGGKKIGKNLENIDNLLQNVGGKITIVNGKKLWKHAGETIFELKNGKILPNLKKHYHQGTGGTPLGEARDGYLVLKVGDDVKVKRKPDNTPYEGTDYDVGLSHHSNAHTLERHGHDVTDDALIKRANQGIAPDGSTSGSLIPGSDPPTYNNIPSYSSTFETPDQLKDGYDFTKPDSPAFESTPPNSNNPNRKKVIYPLEGQGPEFGYGVKKNTEIFETMHRVEAKYEIENGI